MQALALRVGDSLAGVLILCERGRDALMKAASVVEAKSVLSAISTLEHAVKVRDMNVEAVVAASTLRIRAERRVGELLAAQTLKTGPKKLVTGGDQLPSLEDQGLTKKESATFQRLASVSAQKFERVIETVTKDAVETKSAITRAAVMRAIDPDARTPDVAWKDGERFKVACDRLVELAPAAADAIRWGHFPGKYEPQVLVAGVLSSIREARKSLDQIEQGLRRKR